MKLKTLAFAMVAALGVAGAAGVAVAVENSHVITVPLPDGGAAKIRYFGNTPPDVRIEAAPVFEASWPAAEFGPSFADVDRLMAQMDRQTDLMLAQARGLLQARLGSNGLMQAGFGRLPPGASGYSLVSTLTGSGVCTRTVEYRSDGRGQPQVHARMSGDCAAAKAPQAWQANPPERAPGLTTVSYRPAS